MEARHLAPANSSRDFRWWPLGGLGEVGMNCMVFAFGSQVLPVDAGVLFADPNDFGIESLHPDYSALLREHAPRHWLITHAHEDHIGAVAAVLWQAAQLGLEPPEILAPRFAAALIREKITDDSRYPGLNKWASKIITVEMNSWLELGGVAVRFIPIRHSTADACSLAFRWTDTTGRELRLLHTADFKLDTHEFEDGVIDVQSYDVFHGESPDILFIDSTNSERPGRSISEQEIIPGLEQLIRREKGRLFVTLFSSNIYRVATLLKLAGEVGRHVCLAGRSLQSAHRHARDLGIYADQTADFSRTSIVDADRLGAYPAEKQMIICSGSQGEYRSVLAKVAQGQHPQFQLQSEDSVIFSSKLIPGNERPVAKLINGLLRQGARVYWGEIAQAAAGGPIHASGHARSDEIRDVLEFCKPKHVVPVHGELRQLRSCAAIAEAVGMGWGLVRSNIHVVENGTELSFQGRADSENWDLASRKIGDAPPRILRFESFISATRDEFLQVRKRAAAGGVVAVSVDTLGRCQVSARGLLPAHADGVSFDEKLTGEIQDWIDRALKKVPHQEAFGLRRNVTLENEWAGALERHIRRLLGVRPYVVLHLRGEV